MRLSGCGGESLGDEEKGELAEETDETDENIGQNRLNPDGMAVVCRCFLEAAFLLL